MGVLKKVFINNKGNYFRDIKKPENKKKDYSFSS